MEKNNPVYNFVGLKFVSCEYYRVKDTEIDYFKIKTFNRNYNNENNLFSFLIDLRLKFENEEESKFTFAVAFIINDKEWKESIPEDTVEAIFVSSIFPYVREKISSLTDDSRGRFTLPIIDLRTIKLSEGATFTATKNKKFHN